MQTEYYQIIKRDNNELKRLQSNRISNDTKIQMYTDHLQTQLFII